MEKIPSLPWRTYTNYKQKSALLELLYEFYQKIMLKFLVSLYEHYS